MRSAEAEFLQHLVRDIGEIAIGEEQQILGEAHFGVADIDNRGWRRQLGWRNKLRRAGPGFEHA